MRPGLVYDVESDEVGNNGQLEPGERGIGEGSDRGPKVMWNQIRER